MKVFGKAVDNTFIWVLAIWLEHNLEPNPTAGRVDVTSM